MQHTKQGLLCALQHGYDYGVPDCIDLLPPSMSGLCLGACYQLAFITLAFLQPRSPAKPITCRRPTPGQQQQTYNNAGGFVFGQYGGLKHLQPEEEQPPESMGKLVNGAISCASFLSKGWEAVRNSGEGQPVAGLRATASLGLLLS
jgi:hypothetical protein